MLDNGIDIERFKTLLRIEGLDDFFESDRDLMVYIESKFHELEGICGIDILPKSRVKINRKFHGDMVELNFYPVVEVVRVYIDDELLSHSHFNVSYKLGIVYFDKMYTGSIKVEYITGVDYDTFTFSIVPLVKDMVAFNVNRIKVNNLTGGFSGVASSVREGDLSISLANASSGSGGDSDFGYGGGINNRINDLRNRFSRSARVRLL